MELKLGIEVIESYKRLSYKAWYALAEYVDNSTQSYINHKDILDQAYDKEQSKLTVTISYNNDPANGFVQIEDTSIGMDELDLQRALTVGKRPDDTSGRSKYGLGLKTASFWFGDRWEITTKKLGSKFEYKVIADLQELIAQSYSTDHNENNEETVIAAQSEVNDNEDKSQRNEPKKRENTLEFVKSEPMDLDLHYTIIKISKLNRQIAPTTAKKIKDFLKSIYRVDLENETMSLIFQNDHLTWSKKYFFDRMLKDPEGMPYHIQLSFDINGKKVHGWAGVLETGSRRDAGFSILQANRVIQGWPDAYRPTKLFGDQEGGVNDLVNQRLVGELYLDGFDVSHTKDEILFSEDEEDQLNELLLVNLAHFKKAALEYRKPLEEAGEDSVDYSSIVNQLFKEIQSPKVISYVTEMPVLPPETIKESNEEVVERSLALDLKEVYQTTLSGINITVIINPESSSYDPYVVIRSRASRDDITIIVNKNHQHWKTLMTPAMILYFIKHCILDGLAEWKAYFIVGDLDPDTIKTIKDSYLRLDIQVI